MARFLDGHLQGWHQHLFSCRPVFVSDVMNPQLIEDFRLQVPVADGRGQGHGFLEELLLVRFSRSAGIHGQQEHSLGLSIPIPRVPGGSSGPHQGWQGFRIPKQHQHPSVVEYCRGVVRHAERRLLQDGKGLGRILVVSEFYASAIGFEGSLGQHARKSRRALRDGEHPVELCEHGGHRLVGFKFSALGYRLMPTQLLGVAIHDPHQEQRSLGAIRRPDLPQ